LTGKPYTHSDQQAAHARADANDKRLARARAFEQDARRAAGNRDEAGIAELVRRAAGEGFDLLRYGVGYSFMCLEARTPVVKDRLTTPDGPEAQDGQLELNL
jgi:hypothetical protein